LKKKQEKKTNDKENMDVIKSGISCMLEWRCLMPVKLECVSMALEWKTHSSIFIVALFSFLAYSCTGPFVATLHVFASPRKLHASKHIHG